MILGKLAISWDFPSFVEIRSMMNQTNNQKEIVNKGVNWQEAIETSKEVLGGLYKILKGIGRYAWASLKKNASNRLKVFIIALVVSLLY
ncbi:hypothetical protein, partial [Streptococcus sobrinus]